MRFRNFHPHEKRIEEEHPEKQTEIAARTARAAVEVEKEKGPGGETAQRSAIPLEWRGLAPFIEAGRNVRPAEEYVESFWARLRPRIKRLARRNELVREYLRETFWQRWSCRLATAALFALMLYGLYFLHTDNRRLERQVVERDAKIRALRAGM